MPADGGQRLNDAEIGPLLEQHEEIADNFLITPGNLRARAGQRRGRQTADFGMSVVQTMANLFDQASVSPGDQTQGPGRAVGV